MKPATSIGHNRTGMATSPELAAELLEGTRKTVPSARGTAEAMAAVRILYASEAEPVGTMPPPATLKQLATSAARALRGQRATVLVDKLGERLAFERSGVRLYDALISKHDAFGSWPGGPSRDDLLEIREEEREHFLLLKRALEELGADPSSVTPSANVHAVASKGWPAVLSDPRTNLREGMETILIAELVDNDCWENLIQLTRAFGQEKLAAKMEEALEEEREHLRRVREWLAGSLGRLAGSAPLQPPNGSRQRRPTRSARRKRPAPRRKTNPKRSNGGTGKRTHKRARPRRRAARK
jgi:rubrerythrin